MDRIIKKKLWTPKRIIWMALGLIIVVLVLYSLIFGDKSSRLNVQRERLTIEQVVMDSFHDYISITGTVIPISTVYLDAMEGGRVEEILQEEGNLVNEGDVILRLSNTNLHLEIMNREASLAEQMNNLRNTRLLMEQNKLDLKQQILELEYRVRMQEKEYLNKQSLYEKKYISEDEYRDARESYEYLFNRMELVIESQKQDSLFRNIQILQLEESVNRMQDNLNLVRKRLENLNVKAPVAGELAFINAEIGESKSAGERLGQINILDSYKIRAEIDEYYISRIVRGLPGDFEFSGQTYQLEVTKVYTIVTGGRFTVEMEFVSALPERIRTGQTFRIKLELGVPKEAILISKGGFYQTTGGQWVFVVDPSGQFAVKRDIRLGSMNPRYYEVLEGLEPGESVIISSYDNFGRAEKLIIKD